MGNVADNGLFIDKKSGPDDFINIIENSVETVKENWNIEIKFSV